MSCEWKPVEGYEGAYEVSSEGEVKNLLRHVEWTCRDGSRGCKDFPEKILSPKIDKDGYESVGLSLNGKVKHMRVHRLVCSAFNLNINNHPSVDHIDGNKRNNKKDNLQWVTVAENTIKYYGSEVSGRKHLSSLTKVEWGKIGDMYNKGISYEEIATKFKLDTPRPDAIWEVLSAKKLSSVSGFKVGDFTKRQPINVKIDLNQAVEIIKLRVIDKLPLKSISSKYGVTDSLVSRICNGKRQPEALAKFKKEYEDFV